MGPSRFLVATCVAVFIAGLLVGILGGYYSRRNSPDLLIRKADDTISRRLMDEINSENIRENLRNLTARPHLAGTPADRQQAEQLKSFWETEAGLDRARLYPYNVLLSYPEIDNPNKIVLSDGQGRPLFTSQLFEKILRPEQNQSDVVPPFNAYSASGEPKGKLVYVNYARVDDFIRLTEELQIDPTGHICIARYGKIFRGDKTMLAESYGCAGLILYTDPADYAPEGVRKTYPDSQYLPGTGVQRGNVKRSQGLGDPLTPGYPAIESAYRIPESEAGLPGIPVQPIGYDDARVLLSNMTGPTADSSWSGDLPVTYRLGPGFVDQQWKVQMFIYTHTKMVTTYNVMGFIKGAIEPDRYVLAGNHRDAWVFGAVDPSSGTAAMMELSRAMGKLLKEGWRPRRTIVFCSWGAEEHGIIGSREWVEHFGKLLEGRAVAYLNVDSAVKGNLTFEGRGLPLMHKLMMDTAKMVPNPDPAEVARGRVRMYDTWAARAPLLDQDGNPTGKPKIPSLGSGSDFAPFVSKIGVTSVSVRYVQSINYPLYHTIYETFHLVETFVDPTFAYHRAVAQFWGELARSLADDYILPFDVRQYAASMEGYVRNIKDNYGALMTDTGTDGGLGKHSIMDNLGAVMTDTGTDRGLEYLDRAVTSFQNSIKNFLERLNNVDIENPLEVRMLNDKMFQLDRMFTDPETLPNRPLLRNVVFAPSNHNSYAGSVFPGLVDSLFELRRAATPELTAEKTRQVLQQMSVITHWIGVAAASLLDDVEW